jgi:diguanylate cyclase (GGDEF)-like protein
VSIGVVQQPEAGTGLDDVLRTADAALYRAKEAGRNRVAV